NNILSIGQLQQKGLSIVFKQDFCKVYHEVNGLIMSTKMTANHIYGHLSFKGLNTLVKKDMMKGLPQLQDKQDTCAHCLRGKQHRDAIPKSSNWRATKQL
ncbi:retrovirus-related pol polyprotein from transposon tnt 1-94, partial [Trifolium medium]|nr:retrovirus-related pol polyprotein from transposon tnt 1-94 [Trifolium medium]